MIDGLIYVLSMVLVGFIGFAVGLAVAERECRMGDHRPKYQGGN